MAQGNPETFPKGNSNLTKTIRNVAVAGGTAGFILAGALSGVPSPSLEQEAKQNADTLLPDHTVEVSIDDINDLNLIFNDNDCGNAFFSEVCESLKDKGLQFTTSKQNDNLIYENATVITLDQQMIAGEGVAFIGPCQAGTANHSEALLKSMQMTFHQRGWDTDSLAGVMQYVPYNEEEIYNAVPSDTENAVLPDSAYITVSFGTMPEGFEVEKVAEDTLLSLARYQHYLEYDSKNVTVVENPEVPKPVNDNHYFFSDQINYAPSFNSQLVFEVSKENHYSK